MKILKTTPLQYRYPNRKNIDLIDKLFLKQERHEPGSNRRMFNEDFGRLFRSSNSKSDYNFDITSNDMKLLTKLLSNFSTRYKPYSIDAAVRKFIDEIAQSLILFGVAYYSLYDNTEEEIHMFSFSSRGIKRLFGSYIQWVPKRVHREMNQYEKELPREIRILEASKIMFFDMPKQIKRMLFMQNRILATIDKHKFEAVSFLSQATHENPNPANHFDYRVWNELQEQALYYATRITGWNRRVSDSKNQSDFFDCHRIIRFRQNQLLLRDDILKQLSTELSKIGRIYNSEFSVEITATDELSKISYLNELERRLVQEEVEFSEIIDYCFK